MLSRCRWRRPGAQLSRKGTLTQLCFDSGGVGYGAAATGCGGDGGGDGGATAAVTDFDASALTQWHVAGRVARIAMTVAVVAVVPVVPVVAVVATVATA